MVPYEPQEDVLEIFETVGSLLNINLNTLARFTPPLEIISLVTTTPPGPE